MIPQFIREMAEDRAAGVAWRDVAERYGYNCIKTAQAALYKAAQRDPVIRQAIRAYRRKQATCPAPPQSTPPQ